MVVHCGWLLETWSRSSLDQLSGWGTKGGLINPVYTTLAGSSLGFSGVDNEEL
jgi:hypothetical protein